MKNMLTLAAVAAMVAMPIAPLAQANAQGAHDRTYHRPIHHYRTHCRRSSGRTGLLVGAGGGGLGAAALGAGPIGIAAGVVGGGLLGRHLDKRHDAAQNRRNGC